MVSGAEKYYIFELYSVKILQKCNYKWYDKRGRAQVRGSWLEDLQSGELVCYNFVVKDVLYVYPLNFTVKKLL